MARNPKDVIVSYFHHHKLIKFHDFTGDIAGFAEYFMKDERENSSLLSNSLIDIDKAIDYVLRTSSVLMNI